MNQLNLVCLSLTPNLRCVGFTLEQFIGLIIPPAIEGIVSLLFIYSYSGPGRRAQVFLAVDGLLYFIWALLDMLSHVTTVARTSISAFKALDFLVGAVSFTPILIYSIYLYRLSVRDPIPNLPPRIQPYLEISLPILIVTAVAMNEVSSFVGTYLVAFPDRPIVIMFSDNSESLWLSLSQSSLTIYTIVQFLFFLITFSRLSRAFLDQRRVEISPSDQHRYLYGLVWITSGVIVGVIETLAGFAQVSFGVSLARRILRLIARAFLMFGSLKGCDVAERFENFTDTPDGVSGIRNRFSRIFGVNPQQTGSFHRISHSYPERSQSDDYASAEKGPKERHVTVHYETGQAPLLQVRFSTFDFPLQALLPDTVQHRRRSLPGLIPDNTNGGGGNAQQHKENISNETPAARKAILETRRTKSALVANDGLHVPPDCVWSPEKSHNRASGETISDLSVVRDLERKFPNLPPRVTGKYRGSILGQNYEEDPFPVVGISRQPSLRRDGSAPHPNEDGGPSATLSPSNSIKRKPAPPLLENITESSKRPVSTWGGLTRNAANHRAESPVSPNTPTGVTADSHELSPTTEPTTPRSRKRITVNLIKRASRALSDASVRSAEWLASASSPQSSRTPLTAADIEMYRRGNLGRGSARLTPRVGEAL